MGIFQAMGSLLTEEQFTIIATRSSNATLTIINCTLSGNSGDYGGAIFNDGVGNTATLTVMNSTISGNHASQYGGGIWNESGGIVMNVSICTFRGNTSAHSAGAIQFDGSNGTATGSIRSCTFAQNTAGPTAVRSTWTALVAALS